MFKKEYIYMGEVIFLRPIHYCQQRYKYYSQKAIISYNSYISLAPSTFRDMEFFSHSFFILKKTNIVKNNRLFRDLIFYKCVKSGPKLSCREFTRPVFVNFYYLIIVFLDHSSMVVCFSLLICCNQGER